MKDWSEEDIRSIQAAALIAIGDQDIATGGNVLLKCTAFSLTAACRYQVLMVVILGEAMSSGSGSKVAVLFVARIDEFPAAQLA